jgi:hypothetical protein
MTVTEVIDYARAAELRQLSIKDDTPENVADILTYTNLGLIELYKRFHLRTEEAIVTMREAKTSYLLDGTDADVSISSEVNSVLEVYDENGSYLDLNNETNPLSILTPTWNSIQVPYPLEGDTLSIIFSSSPTKLVNTTDVVPIPSTLLEALLHYIGYRAHGALDGNINAENNTHYVRFEASCKNAKDLGVVTHSDTASINIYDKGFV